MNRSPFNHQSPVTPPIFVSREKELDFLRNNIFYNNESVVLEGFFRIGKSSTILTFLESIISGEVDDQEKIFPVRILMTQFYNSLTSDFLSTITHELVAQIWTKVMGYKYSQLLEDTALDVKKSKSISKHINSIKRIYKIVSSASFSSKGTSSNEIGGKLILTGKRSGSSELSLTRKPLQTFEFLLLLDELMDTLSDFGYNKILFFCDELNHLPPAINYELFSTYLDVFSSKRILFALTATNDKYISSNPENVEMEVLINSFSKSLSMGPFQNKEDIKHLIENSLNHANIDNLMFKPEVYDKIFDITEGYPWLAVKLGNSIFMDAYHNGVDIIGMEILDKYSIPYTKTLVEYKSNNGYIPADGNFIDKRYL